MSNELPNWLLCYHDPSAPTGVRCTQINQHFQEHRGKHDVKKRDVYSYVAFLKLYCQDSLDLLLSNKKNGVDEGYVMSGGVRATVPVLSSSKEEKHYQSLYTHFCCPRGQTQDLHSL